MGKGAGAGPGPSRGVGAKAVGADGGDTPGAGGTGGKENLGEKRGSSCSIAGSGATGGKGGGAQGSRPSPLAGLGYWRRGGRAGVGGSLGLGSSGRRKSELRKALESRGPGQLLRAWLGDREQGRELAFLRPPRQLLALAELWTGHWESWEKWSLASDTHPRKIII